MSVSTCSQIKDGQPEGELLSRKELWIPTMMRSKYSKSYIVLSLNHFSSACYVCCAHRCHSKVCYLHWPWTVVMESKFGWSDSFVEAWYKWWDQSPCYPPTLIPFKSLPHPLKNQFLKNHPKNYIFRFCEIIYICWHGISISRKQHPL